MHELWFDPNLYAWIPGTAIGVIGGTLGALTGSIVPSGKHRGLVTGLFVAFIACSTLLLLVGIAALIDRQPMAIWASIGGPGLRGVVVGVLLMLMVRRVYTTMELRRMASMDLDAGRG